MKIAINKIKMDTGSYRNFDNAAVNFKFNSKFDPFLYKDDKEILEKNKPTYYIVIAHIDNKFKEIFIFTYKDNTCFFKYSIKNDARIKYYIGELYINLELDYSKDQYLQCYDNTIVYNRISELVSYLDVNNNIITEETHHLSDRKYRDPYFENNDSFCKDYNLIITSKSFRRLQDKTQIFSLSKGDHFRTRLTHTIEVNEIAKKIAKSLNDEHNLNINIGVVECIAMGHDIGHTPFGHQGERTLENIISNSGISLKDSTKCNILKNASKELYNYVGGFKHNIQSVRILTQLEEHFNKFSGLNMPYEILEGILKHTDYEINDIKQIVDKSYFDLLHCDNKINTYITGKIVKIADEIAQRCHDLEDSFKANLFNYDIFLENIKYKFETVYVSIQKFIDKLCIDVVDDEDVIICYIKTELVNLFVKNIVDNFNKETLEISYSEPIKTLDYIIDSCIKNYVISSKEVVENDVIADKIIRYLFECYYSNPMLLNNNTIRRIYLQLLKDPETIELALDFRNMDKKYLQNEITKINNIDYVDCSDDVKKPQLKRQKIIIRNICDYISGMTDTFAIDEYNKYKCCL